MTLESALNHPGNDVLYQATIDGHVRALAEAQREKLDAALAELRPGWRLCLHLARMGGEFADFQADLYTMRIRQEYHYLPPDLPADQECDVPNRTEYTRT